MAFHTVIEGYCKRFYHEGFLSVADAIPWGESMIRGWHDETEAQVYWELEEPPQTNIQMASDILYAVEHDANAIPMMISELIQSANESVLPFLDQFLFDMKQMGTGIELRNIGFNGFGAVEISFDLIEISTIHLWQAQGHMYRGDRYALL